MIFHLLLYALCIVFLQVGTPHAHPMCLGDLEPQHRSTNEFKLCSDHEGFGCCNSEIEKTIYDKYQRIISGVTSTECMDMIKEVFCQECSPFSGHMYATNYHQRNTLGIIYPGLCPEFCSKFHGKCQGSEIPFMNKSKEEFCKTFEASDSNYCYPKVYSTERQQNQNEPVSGCLKVCFEEVANRLFQPVAAKSPNDGTKSAYDEKGSLDIEFHPDFKDNGLFYMFYTCVLHARLHVRISQFRVSNDDMNKADPSSEKILINIKRDDLFHSHSGGTLLFGEDGYLYISVGDGGMLDERYNRAQTLTTMLGKILRIDVNVPEGDNRRYFIPSDNPYAGPDNPVPGALPEIFASGLRNPWRCTMDRGDQTTGTGKGRLFCGDVGLTQYEEVDLIEKGKNYGWRIWEGNKCSPTAVEGECTQETKGKYSPPIAEYAHEEMDCIIGGYVYRGCQYPPLKGIYITSGLKLNAIRGIKETEEGTWEKKNICHQKKEICEELGFTNILPYNVLSFAEDNDGEFYILSTTTPGPGYQGGKIFRLRYVPDENGGISHTQACSPRAPTTETILGQDVMIEDFQAMQKMQIRLINNGTENMEEGRLEIRVGDGKWGTICGKSFSKGAATVACAMMTHLIREAKIVENDFGKGSGDIWLGNVNCIGSENSLLECYHDGWGNVEGCTHDDDVAIFCGNWLTSG